MTCLNFLNTKFLYIFRSRELLNYFYSYHAFDNFFIKYLVDNITLTRTNCTTRSNIIIQLYYTWPNFSLVNSGFFSLLDRADTVCTCCVIPYVPITQSRVIIIHLSTNRIEKKIPYINFLDFTLKWHFDEQIPSKIMKSVEKDINNTASAELFFSS